jgi:phosphate transport system substrate-binding protein
MPYSWRFFRPVVLVLILSVLIVPLAPAGAQGSTAQPVVIEGTPELESLVTAIRDAYVGAHADAQVTIDSSSGLRGGFQALCNGQTDLVMSTEPITDEMIAVCDGQGQGFIETVLSYEAIVLLPTPEAAVTCLDRSVIDNAWQLGAPASVTWSDLGSQAIQTPVAFYGPEATSPEYLLFRELEPAGDLRGDIVSTPDPANIVAKVQEQGSSGFGFMSLSDWDRLTSVGSLSPMGINDAEGNCISPSRSTLEDRTYPLARTDYLYVNANSAQRSDVQSFVQFALSGDQGIKAIGPEQGYVVADASFYENGVNNVLNGKTGRTFSRPVSPVSVSTSEQGTVTFTGTSMLVNLTNPITSAFKSKYTNATITINDVGNTQGWDSFCKGEADVLQSTRPATEEEKALCDQNGISPYALNLGHEALVFAVPSSNTWAECLNADLVTKMLAAGTQDAPAPMKWSDLNPDWPDKTLLLVVPPLSTGETDYLTFTLLHNLSFVVRMDMTESSDPLYRAQGVANTDNGLTYGWWSDFQGSQASIKLLQVDGGSGCVAPSPQTFQDGTYPLAFPVSYYFSQKAFSNPLTPALLWFFFDQTSLDTIAKHPFAGLDMEALQGNQRDDVYNLLAEYEKQAAEAAPTATPGPTQEVTPGATPEGTQPATQAPTAEVTVTATQEPTQAATAEGSPTVTEEPTQAPTAEVTATATQEPTQAPTAEATASSTSVPEPTETSTTAP